MTQNTTRKVTVVLGIAILLATIAGVWWLADSAEQGSSPIGGTDIAPNSTVPTSPPFHLEGQIHYQFDPSQVEDASFEDVMLCMYDFDEDVITGTNLGTFDGFSEFRNISITTDSIPKLVLIHHPRFYSIDGFQHDVLIYGNQTDRYGELSLNGITYPYEQLERGTCSPPR